MLVLPTSMAKSMQNSYSRATAAFNARAPLLSDVRVFMAWPVMVPLARWFLLVACVIVPATARASTFNAGVEAWERGDLKAARDLFTQARKENPTSMVVLLHWA